jgi:hypothetical protein
LTDFSIAHGLHGHRQREGNGERRDQADEQRDSQ